MIRLTVFNSKSKKSTVDYYNSVDDMQLDRLVQLGLTLTIEEGEPPRDWYSGEEQAMRNMGEFTRGVRELLTARDIKVAGFNQDTDKFVILRSGKGENK